MISVQASVRPVQMEYTIDPTSVVVPSTPFPSRVQYTPRQHGPARLQSSEGFPPPGLPASPQYITNTYQRYEPLLRPITTSKVTSRTTLCCIRLSSFFKQQSEGTPGQLAMRPALKKGIARLSNSVIPFARKIVIIKNHKATVLHLRPVRLYISSNNLFPMISINVYPTQRLTTRQCIHLLIE